MGQWKYNTFGQDRKAAATAYREALAGADHAAWHYDLGVGAVVRRRLPDCLVLGYLEDGQPIHEVTVVSYPALPEAA
jgi:hypothetical protein